MQNEQLPTPKLRTCSKKNVPYLAAKDFDTKTVMIMKPRCWCWNCPECAEARVGRWSKRVYSYISQRMKQGEKWYFVTLTSHEKCVNFTQTAYVLKRQFPTLYKRMLREYSGLMYISIPEPHQDTRLHVHMLSNVPLRQRWYKDNARECGFGYQADAKEILEPSRAAFYVVKYLGKSLINDKLRGKRFQRVRASKDFPDLENDQTFMAVKTEVIGQYEQARIFIAGQKENGWRVIVVSSGEEL